MIPDKYFPAQRDCALGRFRFFQNNDLPWYQYYCDPGLRIDPNAYLWEPVDDLNTFDYNLEPRITNVPITGHVQTSKF
jgi:hypothetical protein